MAFNLPKQLSLFSALVCGHDQPPFMKKTTTPVDGAITFVPYTTTPPSGNAREKSGYLKYEFDRCNEIQRGMQFLENSDRAKVRHWHALDADDLIRHDFVEEPQKYTDRDAIVIDDGYQLHKSTEIVTELNEFSRWCGSSAILKRTITPIPKSFDPVESKNFCVKRLT